MVTRYWRFFLGAGLVLFFDQLIKAVIVGLERSYSFAFGKIVYAQNYGAGFGILQGQSTLLILISVLVGLGILWYVLNERYEKYEDIFLGLLFGGLLGNLVDRLFRGFVVDFISLGSFPTFNIADSAISIGVASLIVLAFVKEKKKN